MNIEQAMAHYTDCECEDCISGTSTACDVLKAEVTRLRDENAELRDAGGDLHFLHPIWGSDQLVAAGKRWQAAVGTDSFNGGELKKLQRENADLRKQIESALRIAENRTL